MKDSTIDDHSRLIEIVMIILLLVGVACGFVLGLFVVAAHTHQGTIASRADKHCTAVKYRILRDVTLLHDTKPTEHAIGAQDLYELAAGDDPFLCTGQSLVFAGEPSDSDMERVAKQIADQIEERP